MTKLAPSELGVVCDLVDGLQCEKALIRTALAGSTKAEVFVDDRQSPNVALLAYNNEAIILGAPQGIRQLEEFVSEIQRHRNNRPLSHISCPTREWRDCLVNLSRTQFDCSERIWYRFNAMNFEALCHETSVANGFTLSRIDHDRIPLVYQQFGGDFRTAWESEDEFVKGGLGFCIEKENELASISFSYFPVSLVLEIGTATKDKFRRQGLARIVNSKLIEECLSHNIEPLWSCYSSNTGSNELAKKLGFEYDHTYYWLCEKRHRLRGLLSRVRRVWKPRCASECAFGAFA